MAVPPCAQSCGLVARLLLDLARPRGTSVAVESVVHGIPVSFACPSCGTAHPSQPDADHCCP